MRYESRRYVWPQNLWAAYPSSSRQHDRRTGTRIHDTRLDLMISDLYRRSGKTSVPSSMRPRPSILMEMSGKPWLV